MAGVGFKLNKIFEKKSMSADNLGVLSLHLTVMGPTFFFLIALFAINVLLGVWQVSEAEIHLFSMTFINISLLAVLISSFMGAVLSRYVSDKVFEEKEGDIGASMYGVLLWGSVVAAVGATFLCFIIRQQVNAGILFLVVYFLVAVLMVNLIHLSIYLSTIKQYGKIILAYGVGIIIFMIIICLYYFLRTGNIVFEVYLATAGGLFVTNLLLVCMVLKAFGTPGKKYFSFLQYIVRHPHLVWSGLALFVGIFLPNISQYEMSMFMAFFIHLPGIVLFEIILQKYFYVRYAKYLSFARNGTYALLDRERETLQNAIRLQIFLAYGIQLAVTLVSVALVNVIVGNQGVESDLAERFMILAIGMFFVFCMYETILILYYFSGYKEAGIATTVFALVVVLGMLVCNRLGTAYALLPLPMGGIVGWIVSSLILRSRLKNINAFILCK